MTTHGRRRATLRGAALLAALTVLAGCSTAISGQPRADQTGAAATTSATVPTQITLPPGEASASSGGPSTAPSSPAPVRPSPPSSTGGRTAPSPPAPSPTETTALPAGEVAGSDGAGDPYYPTAGNGGYQVDSYAVRLSYDPPSNQLDATTTITLRATADGPLGRFDLDLQPDLTVSAVTVDDTDASFTQQDAELIITPVTPLDRGGDATVVVSYSGQPGMITGGTASLADGGWYRTQDGGAVAAGEPFSASAWYPVNEHPSDPAAFSVTATVPDGWQVISNGTKFDGALPVAPDGMHSVRYDEKRPIASYLTTILIGKLTFTTGTFGHVPILNAFTAAGSGSTELAEKTPEVLRVLSKHFGPFPFASYGGIYTGENLSFALETATRPVYASWVDLDTVVHETAHQWYGDDVIIKDWSDICLNECFASYAPWLYHADVDGADLDGKWRREMGRVAGDASFWAIPLVDMGPGFEFTSVYDRGPLALHALRHEMGEDAFAALLKGWISTYGGHNAGFDDLEAYASQLAGKNLKAFMDAWFRGTVVPPEPYRTPPGLG
jgi:aminopeptidase N